MNEEFKKKDPNYCSDCGISRHKSPTPGSCPCCFSPMEISKNWWIAYDGGSQIKGDIYTCTNPKCKRCCTGDFLSGFWSGWKEKERYWIYYRNWYLDKTKEEKESFENQYLGQWPTFPNKLA